MLDKIDFGLTSYIFGIASIVTAFFNPILGLVFGIIGLIQSFRQQTAVSRLAKKLNIIGLILSVLVFAVGIFLYKYLLKSGLLSSVPSLSA